MPKKPLALLDRYDLVQLVCELENTVRKREDRIKELERVLSPGWGAWKFKEEGDE